ncbi:hypothetical protein Peur_030511 [Populus x canadensis]
MSGGGDANGIMGVVIRGDMSGGGGDASYGGGDISGNIGGVVNGVVGCDIVRVVVSGIVDFGVIGNVVIGDDY